MFQRNQLNVGPIDSFPFVNKWYPITVYLTNEIKEGGKGIGFNLSLYSGENADQLVPIEDGIDIDKKSKMEIPCGTGLASAVVNVKFLQPSGVSLFNARKFFLVAQPSSSEHFHCISSGFSEPVVAVNCRLVITNGHEIPRIFFNAEKGKRQKMEIKVKLLDSNGNAVTDRPNLKLNVVLHYDDNTTVDQSKKKMLDISSDSRMFIGETGETSIRFRIVNCVSRKHGNKHFKVSVSADSIQHAARYNDVSFDYSPSIDVRSKVDMRAKARRDANKKTASSDPPPAVDTFVAHEPKPLSTEDQEDPCLKRVRTEEPLSLMSVMNRNNSLGFSTLGMSWGLNSIGSSLETVPPTFSKMWAEEIIAKAESLRWKKVGNASKSKNVSTGNKEAIYDGYEISNPNAVVDEIIGLATKISQGKEGGHFEKLAESVVPVPSRNHSLAVNM